jgi:hypothetical protein
MEKYFLNPKLKKKNRFFHTPKKTQFYGNVIFFCVPTLDNKCAVVLKIALFFFLRFLNMCF